MILLQFIWKTALVLCLFTSPSLIQEEVKKDVQITNSTSSHILIERYSYSDECVLGKMYINNDFVAYTAELPFVGNFENISSIPTGEYTGFVRYDGPMGYRIQLEEVESREAIQLHFGNYISTPNPNTGEYDSRGCILPGLDIDEDNCMPLYSKNAMGMIHFHLFMDEYEDQTSYKNILFSVRDKVEFSFDID